MKDEIINKVAKSPLITIDLEEFYPEGNRIIFDLKDWLFEELILQERVFRENLKSHDWEQYRNSYVLLTCTADAVIPSWAYLLITTYLEPVCIRTVHDSGTDLDTILYTEIINKLNFDDFKDKKIIIKGCSKKAVPQTAYIHLIEKLYPIVDSLMFGEACSTVPLYKRKK